MQRIAQQISRLTGWRRCSVSFLAGCLSLLAFAPLHLWPVMFITIPVFILLLDGCHAQNEAHGIRARALRFAWAGWWFGFGFFFAGLYWIGFAFLVEAEIFAVLLPFAVTLMPAGLALFFSAASAAASTMWLPGIGRLLALALTVTVAEWLRGKILTGFPWNTIGYALTGSDAMIQPVSLVGVDALTLFAMLLFSAPALFLTGGKFASLSRAERLGFPAIMGALLISGFTWGHWRLADAPVRYVDGVRLRIVQPHIPQSEKWKPELRAEVFRRYLEVSQQKTLLGGIGDVTHLIWPESAVPFLLTETPEALQAISNLMPAGGTFITGAARAERGTTPGEDLKVYNSLYVMDDKTKVLGVYDKTHLVPFGEYLPFQETLEALGLSQLTRIKGGFTPGEGTRLLRAPGLPDFIALICYEIIFPDWISEPGPRPGWLLNVTNDAWFGDSAGPHQHFHQARVRGVEQGLPLVRAANNGISAVSDAYGRIIARLPRNTARALDSPLPEAIPATVFVRWGRMIQWLALLVVFTAWAASYARRHNSAA